MEFVADTNIIIRLLTNDDAAQSEKIIQMIEEGNTLYLTSAVVIECCWVLKSYYKFKNKDISDALLNFIESDEVDVEEEVIESVLQVFGKNNLDIVDVYLSVKSNYLRMPVLTWDKGFKRLNCEWYPPDKM